MSRETWTPLTEEEAKAFRAAKSKRNTPPSHGETMNLTLEDFTRESKSGVGRSASDHPVTSVTPHGHPFGIRGSEVRNTAHVMMTYFGGNHYHIRRMGHVLWSLNEGMPGVYYIFNRTLNPAYSTAPLTNMEYLLNWSVKLTHNERNDRFCVTLVCGDEKPRNMSSLCLGKLLMKTKKFIEKSTNKCEKSV